MMPYHTARDEKRGEQMQIKVGDIVTRISYNHDLHFVVHAMKETEVILHGVDYRLIAHAPLEDLVKASEREINEQSKENKIKKEKSYRLFRQDFKLMKEKREYEATDGYTDDITFFQLPTKVLHVDGDETYLRKCIALYKRMGLHVHGAHITEKNMPHEIGEMIEKVQPRLVIITGHDAYSKNLGKKNELRSYRNSKHFVEAVRAAREVVPDVDQLVIFAGACQSHFEALIRAGANFASSPSRINIHALDPVFVAAKIAYTSFVDRVNVWEVLRNTFTGEKGLGGIETKGLLRTGMPFIEEGSSENND